MHAYPLLPEPEMAQDALDDILIVDERNDAHLAKLIRTRRGAIRPPAR